MVFKLYDIPRIGPWPDQAFMRLVPRYPCTVPGFKLSPDGQFMARMIYDLQAPGQLGKSTSAL
jgi:hypothetical protein